jgi:sporulation protein YlmC with PRC-barrel domain
MLTNVKKLYGKRLAAKDGEIGHIKDFYFHDVTWAVRYVVVDTGTWLQGRMVLLSPHAFGHVDPDQDALRVLLTRQRVENCPPVEILRPISRQYEEDFYRYYGWPAYWQGGQLWGMAPFPAVIPADAMEKCSQPASGDETHLQSTRSLEGYRVEAVDGGVGEVTDLMIDLTDWSISDVVVQAGHWYAGKKVRVTTGMVKSIGFEDSSIFINLARSDIERAHKSEVALPPDVPHGAVPIRDQSRRPHES